MSRLRTLVLAAILLLAACTPAGSPTVAITSPNIPPSPTPAVTETPQPSATSTSAVVDTPIVETVTPPPTETPLSLLTITPAPLPLFFPTVIPAKGAEYRPPLYPVPWALSPHDHFYFANPIAATYPADPQTDYLYGGTLLSKDVIHSGIDLPAPYGTDVLAAGPGTVVWAGAGLFSNSEGNTADPYGLAVAIRHDFGYQGRPLFTIYAHMEDVDVVAGQWVNTGDVVGHVGSTGNATGPHLHFEVRLGKNNFFSTLNPELWIAPPEGYGVLVGRVMNTGGTLLDSNLVVVRSATDEKTYWYIHTYAHLVVNPDPYYNENLVMGNLPAGVYELAVVYVGWEWTTKIQILPGQVNYFSFTGGWGYNFLPLSSPTITPIP